MDAAILFEADAYRLDGPKLMGRQSAGNSFLRAMVKAHEGRPVWGFSPYSDSSAIFQKTVQEIDPAAQTRWIPRSQLPLMAERGVLFRPDCEFDLMAKLRLRAGPTRYSLCGMTHTLVGKPLLVFPDYAALPLAPWDALICTSRAAVSVVTDSLDAQDDYLAWRLGPDVRRPDRVQLPIIPLGVHVDDFQSAPADRAAARTGLAIEEDEVVALFAGRLSMHAKAHPFQTFAALQEVCVRTRRRVTLIQAGKFPTASTENLYRKAMADFCPDVRAVFVDGADSDLYRSAWLAADLFISLSDNIQETFGITPLEAMANGLPVIVSDWDGYRDTVRDGVDGFLVPSRAPAPGMGDQIARAHEVGDLNYDYMLFRTCVSVSVDAPILVDRLTQLVTDEALRRRLGAAGRARARESYDWTKIYARYQALWDELTAIRLRLTDDQEAYWNRAPRHAPAHPDPYSAFAQFPTEWVAPDSPVTLAPGALIERYAAIATHQLFQHWKVDIKIIEGVFAGLDGKTSTAGELAGQIGLGVELMTEVIARMMKMQVVQPAAPPLG